MKVLLYIDPNDQDFWHSKEKANSIKKKFLSIAKKKNLKFDKDIVDKGYAVGVKCNESKFQKFLQDCAKKFECDLLLSYNWEESGYDLIVELIDFL